MVRHLLFLLFLMTLAAAVPACVPRPTPETSVYAWQLPDGVAPPPGATDQAAIIELGRYLFYDRRLSGNGTLACASCHRQELAFSDGRATPVGATGAPLARNAPALLNVGYLATLNWADPDLTSLEQQIQLPLFHEHPPEMDAAAHREAILAHLRADRAMARRFAAAFPADADPLRWERITEALAAFLRTLVARNTPYDQFVYQGDTTALSPAAQRGMQLFFAPGPACGHCHVDLRPPEQAGPPRWADLGYLSNGVGRSPDRGLAAQTGNPEDAYRFRVPPLRNVAVTAPYMHDGSLPTLEAVLRFYASGGRRGAGQEPHRAAARHPLVAGFVLSDGDRQDLLAFLEALTDQDALTDPRFSDPFAGEE